jgi:hypothetical protein
MHPRCSAVILSHPALDTTNTSWELELELEKCAFVCFREAIEKEMP